MTTSHLAAMRQPGATFTTPAAAFPLTKSIGRLLIDRTGGAGAIQLPDPTTVPGVSWYIEFTDDSQNAITFTRFGGEQIQGLAANTIRRAPYGAWILTSTGVNWILQGQNRLDLIYTVSDTETVQAGWRGAEVYIRAGAGGGGGGGNGAAGAGTTGGGGGKGGGGGCPAMGVRRNLTLPVAGTVLTLTVGAGGAGGAATVSGSTGSPSEILDGATSLLRTGHNGTVIGGGAGSGGNSGAGGTGATGGGQAGTAANAIPNGWGTIAVTGGDGGNGGNAVAGSNGAATSAPSATGSPWRGTTLSGATPAATGAAAGGGTHGGGGGGGSGGGSTYADEYSPSGVVSTSDAGRGGHRVTTEGNGGAGNGAGTGAAGQNGLVGYAGTNGRGGGGGQGGGGGGAGSAAGGAGGTGGTGGAGSDGVIVLTVWE